MCTVTQLWAFCSGLKLHINLPFNCLLSQADAVNRPCGVHTDKLRPRSGLCTDTFILFRQDGSILEKKLTLLFGILQWKKNQKTAAYGKCKQSGVSFFLFYVTTTTPAMLKLPHFSVNAEIRQHLSSECPVYCVNVWFKGLFKIGKQWTWIVISHN